VDALILTLLAAGESGGAVSAVSSVLSVVFGLGLVIFFHELGHFAVAKWCGVHVERFSIGLGPILWSRQKGETEYALSAFPFGGYVKMLGQDDMDPNQMTSSEIAENPRSYSAKSVPQRMAIISAGVIMNVLTGFLFFVTCSWFGFFEAAPVVDTLVPGLPAWEEGVRPGDRITAINGKPIQSFGDIRESVMLSSGDVVLEGVRQDATEFRFTLKPERFTQGRSIGVRPAIQAALVDQIPDEDLISDAGLPMELADGRLQPGDRIIGVRPLPSTRRDPRTDREPDAPGSAANAGTAEGTPGEAADAPATTENQPAESAAPNAETQPESAQDMIPVRLLYELKQIAARYADRTLVLVIERKTRPGAADSPVETVEIKVPPAPVRSLGLWMAMGPVTAIQKGSVAEAAGLQVDDKIVSVDQQQPGRDIDPLQLPVYFASRAGKSVTVVVNRASSSARGDEEVTLTMVPDDRPGWAEAPPFQTSPLVIPAIGAGYQILPRIARVLPGSEAGRSGKFAPDMKITRVVLVHPEPGKGHPDAFGDKEKGHELNLLSLEEKETGSVDQINWAWAFSMIQLAPQRHLQIYFDDGKTTGSTALTQTEHEKSWWLWVRGINGSVWDIESDFHKAASFGDAVRQGLRQTRKTAISIYMMLRSLVRGDVAMDSISGPVGIAKLGYRVAEQGWIDLVRFLGILSINLAIMNFLPIPILDGGHMVFLIWEGVTRRKPSPRVIGWAHAAGLLFIAGLFVFVMYIDLFVSSF
jgi:regulator of sigma E protease